MVGASLHALRCGLCLGYADDLLMAIPEPSLQCVLNAGLNRWALMVGMDPRDAITQEEILARFADDYPLSEEGVYYILADTLGNFCNRIGELAADRILGQEGMERRMR